MPDRAKARPVAPTMSTLSSSSSGPRRTASLRSKTAWRWTPWWARWTTRPPSDFDQLGIRTGVMTTRPSRTWTSRTATWCSLPDLPIAMYYAVGTELKFVGQPLNPGYYDCFRKDQRNWPRRSTRPSALLNPAAVRIYEKPGTKTSALCTGRIRTCHESSGKWTSLMYRCCSGAADRRNRILSMALAVSVALALAPLRPMAGPGGGHRLRRILSRHPRALLLYFLYYGLPAISDRYDL